MKVLAWEREREREREREGFVHDMFRAVNLVYCPDCKFERYLGPQLRELTAQRRFSAMTIKNNSSGFRWFSPEIADMIGSIIKQSLTGMCFALSILFSPLRYTAPLVTGSVFP